MELKELIGKLNLQLPWENIISCQGVLSGLSPHSPILRATHTNSPWSCAQLQVNFQQLLVQQEQPEGASTARTAAAAPEQSWSKIPSNTVQENYSYINTKSQRTHKGLMPSP